MPIGAITAVTSTIGSLFKKNDAGQGILKKIFGTKESRQMKRAARQAKRAGRKAEGTLASYGEASTANLQAKINQAGIWLKYNWYWVAIPVGLLVLYKLLGKKKRRTVRKGRRSSPGKTVRRSTTKSKQSVIKTKSGKVIRGVAAVAAYKKRIRNLAKAQRARRK